LGKQVSAQVTLPGNGVVERVIHFSTPKWHGSTDKVGVPAPAKEWDFAEGSTSPSFSEYLTLENPNPGQANVELRYQTDKGDHPLKTLALPPNSRTTVEVFHGDLTGTTGCTPNGSAATCGVGPGVGGVAVQVTSDLEIVAERPMYVNGANFGSGVIRDGHDAFGANAAGTEWDFAEGTTQPEFKEYLTIANPGGTQAHVSLRYVDSTGTVTQRAVVVAPQTRFTVEVFNPLNGVGPGVGGVSVQITSDQRIVAERPMYMVHNFGTGSVAGAHDVMGATGFGQLFRFAAADTASGDFDYLTIQNPDATKDASVTLKYYAGGSPITRSITVPAHSRSTIEIFGTTSGIGRGYSSLGITVEASVPVLVEKPAYSSNASSYGATVTMGS
jgi:hypothetical protein